MSAVLARSAPTLRVVLALLAFTLAGAIPRAGAAQSARASFFLQMLRSNPDARVRSSAALRLGQLHEEATVPDMIAAYQGEHDPVVQAAIIAAFADIRDPRALATVQAATRSPSPAVSSQARRALPVLQSAASSTGGGSTPSGPSIPSGSGPAQFLIGIGTVNNQSSVGGAGLAQNAQQALESALRAQSGVVVHSGSAAQGQAMIRSQHLRGHFFNANIQNVTQNGGAVHVEVSIVVSSYPGRAYEFDSSSRITITGGATVPDAVRRALESATSRAVNQLRQGP
jgi:hypothetical protein